MSPVRVITSIGKQLFTLTRRLLVIERLSMRQRLGRTENVNRSVHILMDQARQLEISGIWENDGEGLPRYHRGRGYACRTIECGRVGRKPGTPISEKGARLIGC